MNTKTRTAIKTVAQHVGKICYKVKVISTSTKHRKLFIPETAQVVFIGEAEGYKWSFTRHLHLSFNGEYYSGRSITSRAGIIHFPLGIALGDLKEWEVSI